MKIYNTHFFHSHILIAWNHYSFLKTYYAIHTTLYCVSCIEYTWLFVNAQFYAVLCISYSKCIFFWHSDNLIAQNQRNFLKTYENIHSFSFTLFNSMKTIQLFKNILGNSHDFVSCKLYWIHLAVCERSILCCIVHFVFQMYFNNGI